MLPNPRPTPHTEETPDRVEQELEDFSYMVSHDMAATFRHMSEFSRLLLADLGEDLTPRQRGFAQRIRVANEHCQSMMEQLLIFSRTQQKPLARVSLNATHLMRIAALRLGTAIHAADAEVEIGPLGEVYADEELLALAFHHLLDNAVKFRRPGVKPRISITAASSRGDWVMWIADNGQGVAAEYQEKAFRMFQRLRPGDGLPGVGAGLPLCRRIARRHGGEARFVEQFEGACVELTIPRGREIH